MNVHILYIGYEMLVPMAASLKEKRSVIKSLKEKLKRRFNVSVAEVGYLDKWQRSSIAVVLVGNEKAKLIKDQTTIELMVNDCSDIELVDSIFEWL